MTDLFTHCEHLNLWGVQQPLGVLSSTGFWLVAWWLYHQYKPKLWSYPFWLIAGIEFIGWASLFWHLTHSHIGMLFDIFSVVFWLGFYGAYALRQKLKWPYLKGGIIAFVFLALSWALGRALDPWLLQSSAAFLPLTLLLLWAGWQTRNKWWTYSGLILALATVLRMIDLPLCGWLPTGTHWLWHLGCAASLYTAMRAVLGKPKKA